jgi:hypothetical protein
MIEASDDRFDILQIYLVILNVKEKYRITQSVQRLGYGLDDRGSRIRFPARNSCDPPSLLSNGYQGLFP